MLKSKITRRQFLKGSVALTAAATALSFLELNSKKLNAAELYEPGWNVEWRPNMCAFCANVCGEVIRVHKKGSKKRPLKLEGNRNDNYNQGKLCARGQAGLKYLFNKDRITKPLIRIPGSKRGEWKFKEASWQEAYGYIMQKMMEANVQPHEILFLGGWHGCAQYRPVMFPALVAFRTFNVWGSPIQNCVGIEHIGIHATFGYFNTHDEMVVDFPNANFILVVRNNASLTGISTGRAHRFGLALKNGAEVYVVDVRRSEAAARAHKWLKIKPGTDNAFALALLHVVLHEEYYGKKLYEHNIDFLKYHTNAPFLVVKMKHPLTGQETWWLLSEKVGPDGKPLFFTVERNGKKQQVPLSLWYKNFYVWDSRNNRPAELKGYSNSNEEDVNGNPVDPALELPEPVRKGLLEGLKRQNPAVEDVKTVWELLKEKTKEFTPEWAEKITEIPAEDIRETAIKFATKRPSVIEPGIYDARYANTVQLRKTLALLQAIVNGHDNIGGYIVGGEYRHKVAKFAEWMKKNNRTYLTLPINDYPFMKLPGMIFMMQFFFQALMPNAQNPKAVEAFVNQGNPVPLATCAFGYPTIEVQKSLEQWLKFMQNPRKEEPGVAFAAFGDYGWDKAFEKGSPYKPKVVFGYAINPVLGNPYGAKWKEWMKKADLVVFVDTMPTDSNAYADVILPDLTFLERKEILGKGNSHHLSVIQRLPAVDKPIGNSKHALDIFFDMIASMVGAQILMRKYGIDLSTPEGKQKAMEAMRNPQMMKQAYKEGGDYFMKLIAGMNGWNYQEFSQKVWKAISEGKPFTEGLYEYTLEEVAKEAGKPVEEVKKVLDEKGIYNIEELEELLEKWAIPEKIPTSLPSGRVELFSTLFEMAQAFYGYLPNWDPLCTYVPPRRKENNLDANEFFVAHGKAPIFSHTGMHTLDNPLLVGISEWKKLPEIYYHIWMHPNAAKRLGIKNGDLVEIYNAENPEKRTKAYVWVTEWVREDTIFIPFNGGAEVPKKLLSEPHALRPPKAVRHVDIVEYKVEPVIAGYTKDETTIKVRKVS